MVGKADEGRFDSCYKRYYSIGLDILREKVPPTVLKTRMALQDFLYDQFHLDESLSPVEDRPLKTFPDSFVYLGQWKKGEEVY